MSETPAADGSGCPRCPPCDLAGFNSSLVKYYGIALVVLYVVTHPKFTRPARSIASSFVFFAFIFECVVRYYISRMPMITVICNVACFGQVMQIFRVVIFLVGLVLCVLKVVRSNDNSMTEISEDMQSNSSVQRRVHRKKVN